MTAALAVAMLGSGCGSTAATKPPEAAGPDKPGAKKPGAKQPEPKQPEPMKPGPAQSPRIWTGSGDWEPAAGAFKEALAAGKVTAVAPPSQGPPSAEGDVVWEAGGRRTVAIITAAEALAALAGEGRDCPRCETIRVTGARLGTARIQTATGAATAPAWQFTVKGSAVPVTRVAFGAGVTVRPPPWNADDPPGGLRIDAATVTGTTLTAQFVGAPQPATLPSGMDCTAEVVASANAVVVIVMAHPFPGGQACRSIGAPRTATVRLAGPLGDRAVLEVQQGTPVPVTVE
ncbi:hypothetical protein Daura_35360 [Dactylosporangium aurantiacum]|uniref:Uncharacterized protein n=2 Tax=Dactylosporangium aurantiacum TaxID=35754 RepID=A0A9Q9MJI8_9ACTN|nr:hypothetical protein [Dactylosporangium aurantiacum]UWZ51957.1 hypothetical protein Daura_35360 [Dactylosporangium aurantiacum]